MLNATCGRLRRDISELTNFVRGQIIYTEHQESSILSLTRAFLSTYLYISATSNLAGFPTGILLIFYVYDIS